jgi:hypothetical protein
MNLERAAKRVAPAANLDRAKDSLEGQRRGTTAGDPLTILAVSLGQDPFGVGAFEGLREEAAFEELAAAFDAGLQELGEISIRLGHGQLQSEQGLKVQALRWDRDWLGEDRSWKLLRGPHGHDLRWRGGVAMHALLPTPSQTLQIRAQTGPLFRVKPPPKNTRPGRPAAPPSRLAFAPSQAVVE